MKWIVFLPSIMIAVEENRMDTFKYDLDENRMFIFYWNEDEQNYNMKYLRGLDKDRKIIYEDEKNNFDYNNLFYSSLIYFSL
ncbi:hypothetical protein [Clostridium sp. DL1XJH146]